MPRESQIAQHKKAFIVALEESLGVITVACKQSGINRRRVYRWMDQDPKFKAAVDEIGEIALDFAESQLFRQMKEGNVTSIIFYLKTKGRRRGYIEGQQIDMNVRTVDAEWEVVKQLPDDEEEQQGLPAPGS